ncbi:MAG: hypothetical protein CMN05_07985 [Roseibacillus sp.]|jgi:hypothetical protein|nr:hypothetical protein [Roseibacillus sp.]MBP36639.1 hypothetical protein [Roseibacillus sp.]MCP4732052.1 hypothetical protein [Roseibacillus sp.]MDP7106650.1 hypothetical protein [Roseibacillus sp.]MDP7306870.1 hypothetical protein [Roseibacillus sp.]|tara:strand:- start:7285 stop:7716 length:432 start_codon:yes stop_codon:yes gene_type:complete
MNIPAHFKFLLDSVEFTARRTDPVLHHDSRHLWDDIVDSFEDRHEKSNYWIFCTRWMREETLKVMHRGSPRALLGILSILRPKDVPTPNHSGEPSAAMKRRVVAMLLPVLMAELVVRIHNEAVERLGPYSTEAEIYHPEDHRD